MKLIFPAWFIALLTISACFIALPAIGQDDFWSPPPLDQIQTAPKPDGGNTNGSIPPIIDVLNPNMKFVSPAPGAVLRGIANVKIEGLDKDGFVVFKINDEFAYATVYPYKMLWDTQGAQDGVHIIRATAYSMNGRVMGVTSLTVNVKNRIASPAGVGVSLEIRPNQETAVTREIEAISSVAGLGGDTTLPEELLALQSQLFARIGQSIVASAPGGLVDIRSTIRQGAISTDKKELPFKEKGYYGIYTLNRSGLAIPPSPGSRRPRIGLTEISLEVPTGKVREGTSWVAPMRVVAELVQRSSLLVTGTHTFEGLWWMQERKCARITSSYEISSVALTGAAAEDAGISSVESEGMGLLQPDFPNITPTQPGFADLLGGDALLPGGPESAPLPVAQTGELTQLSGLSGVRTTWIDIEKGIVVRIEDDISGTFVFAGAGGEGLIQRLPYNLSLTEELVN